MPTNRRTDPYRNFRYLLEIDGITQAGFSDVTIGDSSQEPIEYREGDEPPTVRKVPGLVKYGNLSLKWGITDSMDLYNWRKAVMEGQIEKNRKNVAVLILDELGKQKARWNFQYAWPTKYEAPTLSAKGNDIAIETLEIAHEGMERVK